MCLLLNTNMYKIFLGLSPERHLCNWKMTLFEVTAGSTVLKIQWGEIVSNFVWVSFFILIRRNSELISSQKRSYSFILIIFFSLSAMFVCKTMPPTPQKKVHLLNFGILSNHKELIFSIGGPVGQIGKCLPVDAFLFIGRMWGREVPRLRGCTWLAINRIHEYLCFCNSGALLAKMWCQSVSRSSPKCLFPSLPHSQKIVSWNLKKITHLLCLLSVILSFQSYSVFQIAFLSQEIVYFGKHFISRECQRETCVSSVAPILWGCGLWGWGAMERVQMFVTFLSTG